MKYVHRKVILFGIVGKTRKPGNIQYELMNLVKVI